MTAVIRELKEAGLAIAGADRLKLTEHIAVEDLMALGRVMVLPEDDLALAGVLKSPLFDLDDDDLIELCQRPRGVALYDHLARLGESGAGVSAKARGIHERLESLRQVAINANVHGFYAHVLGRMSGRKAFTARLGSEAEDVLDAFEKAALDHERQGGAGGLEAFLAELIRASPEIKREVDVRRDEIRVITVHAAKGLEAPIVFLVDPCSPAFIAQHVPSVIRLGDGSDDFGSPYLWAAGAKDATVEIEARFAAIRTSAEEEYRRLLYVGMTRAADRLIVCGYRGVREPKEDHWHAMVERALKDDAREIRDETGEIVELVWQSPDAAIRDRAKEQPLAKADGGGERPAAATPDWLLQQAKHEPAMPKPLNPSAALALKGKPVPEFPQAQEIGDLEAAAAQRRAAIERGTAIHRLMQMLPDADPADRESHAMAWLERHFSDWDMAARRGAVEEALQIIGDPRFTPLFASGSRAEAGIAGDVTIGGREITVSGQIDRLAIHENEIVLADYKTNRLVSEAAESHRLQLALYRALLRRIYPEKQVRCMLIWTRDGSVTEFEESELDAALAEITPA
jgi:ATP-dependent helicase/nuclease subunit A